MGTKIIPVEPHYLNDPKHEFSIKIDNHMQSYHKQRKVFYKLNSQPALGRNKKKQGIFSERCTAVKDSIFAAKNLSTDALLPLIDSAMKLQQNAYEAALATNRGYELQLLLIFLEAFISIVFNFYYMISVMVQPEAFKLPIKETIAYLSQHLLQPAICIMVTVLSFSLLKYEFRKSQKIINKIIIHSKDKEVGARFLAFSQQLQTTIPEFTVFGFFALDGSVIFSMISATTTYLIILVQALGGISIVIPPTYSTEMNETSIH